MNLPALIVEITAGALTGYITNDLAVKMLFRQYGPFGGVIVKKRQDFIKNISQLVEKDLITTSNLSKELEKPDFQQVFSSIILDFFTEKLYSRTHGVYFHEIPGLKSSINKSTNFLQGKSTTYLPEFFVFLSNNYHNRKLLSSQDIKKISCYLVDTTTRTLSNNYYTELNHIYRDLKYLKIKNIITQDLIETLTINLKESRSTTQKNIDFIKLLTELYKQFGISILMKNYEERLKEKSLKDLMSYNSLVFDNNNLEFYLREIGQLLQRAETQQLTENLLKNLINSLKSNKQPLSYLLENEVSAGFFNIIKEKVQLLLVYLLNWIRDNKDYIDRMLREAVEHSLKKEINNTSGWKIFIKNALYQFFREKILQDNQLAEQLIDYFNTNDSAEQIAQELYRYMLKALENTSPADIINQLEKHLELEAISKKILTELNSYLENIKTSDKILNNKLKDLFPDNFSVRWERKIRDSIIKVINEFLDSNNVLPKLLPDSSVILDKTIADIIDQKSFITGPEKLHSYLSKNKNLVYKKVDNILENNLKSFSLNKRTKKQLIVLSSKSLTGLVQNKTATIYGAEITSLIDWLNARINYNKTAITLTNLLESNLPVILKDKVAGAIAGNLSQVNDREMEIMVEDFMGRELKPITLLGAGLGGLTAGIIYLSGLKAFAGLPVSILGYGFIGYLTNVIALKMIFRPYNQKKALGIPIPFTPGVIAREKDRLADSLGNFINKELLDDENINELFRKNRGIINKNIFASLQKDNYLMLKSLFNNNSNLLANNTMILIKENSTEIADFLTTAISKTKTFEHKDFLLDKLNNFLKDSNNGTRLINSIKDYRLQDIINLIGKDVIKANLYPYLDITISQMIKRYSSPEIAEKILLDLQNYLSSKTGRKKIVSLIIMLVKIIITTDTIQSKIYKIYIKNNNKTIGQLFQGKIYQYINSHSSQLLDFLTNKGLLKLSRERDSLKSAIRNLARDNLGFWYQAGKLIDIYQTMDSIIDYLLDQGLPQFLSDKKVEIDDILSKTINSIASIKVSDLDIKLSKNQLNNSIINLLSNNQVEENLVEIFDAGLRYVILLSKTNRRIKEGFSVFILNNIKLIQDSIETIDENYINNKEGILNSMLDLGYNILERDLFSQKISSLFKELSTDTLQINYNIIYKKLFFKKSTRALLDRFITLFLKDLDKNIAFYTADLKIDKKILQLIKVIVSNPESKNSILKLLEKIFIEVGENLHKLVESDTINYLIGLLTDSILDSVEKNFLDLLNSFDTERITREEVKKMNPAQLEELFYSFAGPYFNRLERYGWIGSLIGLVTELAKKSF